MFRSLLFSIIPIAGVLIFTGCGGERNTAPPESPITLPDEFIHAPGMTINSGAAAYDWLAALNVRNAVRWLTKLYAPILT